jgi:putative SOS response-associated peptidase YedK
MCQRYVLSQPWVVEREFMPATAWWKFEARYNVAAEQYVPAIRVHENQTEGVMLRWGMIPSWLEGRLEGPPRISVSAARVDSSKICGGAWAGGQRCIIPMAGFYAWQLTPEKHRQPYFVHVRDRDVFGVAGLWDRWVSEEDDVIESVTLISVAANELVSGIAGPIWGMPSILRRRDYATWLQGDPHAARAALQPYPAKWMRAYAVSPRVNSSVADDPALIRAVG